MKARLTLKIRAGARRTEFMGRYGDARYGNAWKLHVTAPPVDGKANQAVIEFLSELFGVAKSSIVIVSGETGRNKLIAVRGLSAEQVRKALGV